MEDEEPCLAGGVVGDEGEATDVEGGRSSALGHDDGEADVAASELLVRGGFRRATGSTGEGSAAGVGQVGGTAVGFAVDEEHADNAGAEAGDGSAFRCQL